MTQDDSTKDGIHEFYQLWQEQLATISRDPDMAKTMLTVGEQAYASMNQFMQQAQRHDNADETCNETQANSRPDFDLSGNSDDAIIKLHARIIACEERIAQLEAGITEQGKEAREDAA